MNQENNTQSNINELIKKIDEKLEEIKEESSTNSNEGDDIKDILNYIHEHPQNLQDFLETIKEKTNK